MKVSINLSKDDGIEDGVKGGIQISKILRDNGVEKKLNGRKIEFDADDELLRKLLDATEMFNGVTLSTANYNSLLVGWNNQVLHSDVVFDGGNSTYTTGSAADTARANMVDLVANGGDHWTITVGGSVANDPPTLTDVGVSVAYLAGDTSVILDSSITVGDGDYGKIIGKGGRNISAIRTIIFAINAKQGGKRARLDVID
jgi:predicted RNA-binding protein YlqC (UPF0109 family)